MRMTLPMGAAAVALMAALTGCAGGSTDSGGGKGIKTLTFLTFETPNLTAQYWDAGIKRAQAKVPGIKIKKLVSPNVDRTAYAKQLAASGQLPDIMASVAADGFAQAGRLAPYTDDELKPYIWPHSNQINGKTYALPDNTQPTPLVYYNKKMFADAGITAPPTTFRELLDDSAKLKAKGNTPFIIGGGGGDTWASVFAWTALIGTDVYKQDPKFLYKVREGKADFTDPRFKASAQKLADLGKKGYIPASGLSRNYADTEKAFLGGQGAMYPMGSWFAASADRSKPPFGVGVFPWPTDDGSKVVPADTGGGIIVSSHAPDVAKAKAFALAFSQDPQNIDALVHSDAAIPAIKGFKPPSDMGPAYMATYQLYKTAEAKGEVVPAFSIESGDGALLPGIVDRVNAYAQDLITGRKSVDQVVSSLQLEWKKARK